MNSTLETLPHLPPSSQRAIMLHNAPPVPVYFLQVPNWVLRDIRRVFDPPPPMWPRDAPVDPDGERTWRIVFSNDVTIYIRSQPVPNDTHGMWALSPSREEIFIPQSLLEFEFSSLEPLSPPRPQPAQFPGPPNVPTLLTHCYDHAFRGRQCKICRGQDTHDIYCPSIKPDFFCEWCLTGNGMHRLGCAGFAPHQHN